MLIMVGKSYLQILAIVKYQFENIHICMLILLNFVYIAVFDVETEQKTVILTETKMPSIVFSFFPAKYFFSFKKCGCGNWRKKRKGKRKR